MHARYTEDMYRSRADKGLQGSRSNRTITNAEGRSNSGMLRFFQIPLQLLKQLLLLCCTKSSEGPIRCSFFMLKGALPKPELRTYPLPF